MSSKTHEGFCRYCAKTFSGSSIGRHLTACKVRKLHNEKLSANSKKKGTIYHIRITSGKAYWLHIEVRAKAQLFVLDDFLKKIWLECCGHLSQFTIKGIYFSIEQDDWGFVESEIMDTRINNVLQVKDKFTYEYDFGSTTYLDGQVTSERNGVLTSDVIIMARNNPTDWECEDCNGKATQICTDCRTFFCDDCLEDHECGNEFALPVVNSPRMGVCGYCGELDDDKFQSIVQDI